MREQYDLFLQESVEINMETSVPLISFECTTKTLISFRPPDVIDRKVSNMRYMNGSMGSLNSLPSFTSSSLLPVASSSSSAAASAVVPPSPSHLPYSGKARTSIKSSSYNRDVGNKETDGIQNILGDIDRRDRDSLHGGSQSGGGFNGVGGTSSLSDDMLLKHLHDKLLYATDKICRRAVSIEPFFAPRY